MRLSAATPAINNLPASVVTDMDERLALETPDMAEDTEVTEEPELPEEMEVPEAPETNLSG
jgi:hypothetical protein